MGSVIGGLIMAGIGFMITWKSEWIYENFGTMEFAEKYLHFYGGGRLFYKLFGFFVTIIGFLIMTGLISSILLGVFGGLFSGLAPARQ